MRNTKLIGTGVALVTPFDENCNIDFNSLKKIIEKSLNNGINYFVVLGTTAESVTLSLDEQDQILKFVIKIVNKRVPIVLGMGGNNTDYLLNRISKTNFSDITAILSVAPYYNKPTQEGLFQHYSKIAEKCPIDILLYNVPGRTSSNIEPETISKLANSYKNIVGVKEASGDIAQCMDIKQKVPKDFLLISGDDKMTFPIMMLGGHGVISVQAMVFPKIFSSMVKSTLDKNLKIAQDLHFTLLKSVDMFYIEGNPAGVKQGLCFLGLLSSNQLRLPLVKMSQKNSKLLNDLISETLRET